MSLQFANLHDRMERKGRDPEKMEKADQQCLPSDFDQPSKRLERMRIIEERFGIRTNDQLVCSKIEERQRLGDHLITETKRAGLEDQIRGLLRS
ncbi:hypothetical protein PCASD_09507 [Puccinia coronata f. sp. avenae]|uniref:Uncharacterized protein n=1 Tax=Puccinia coronata f. sp. avenae TaxID=200324 RepID=A0A2N5U621_9BASI|nr:hypothetical protein PCASD_09507 [Puccinia coronata f. sp. avenae]